MHILMLDKPDIVNEGLLDHFFSIPPSHPQAAEIVLEQLKGKTYPRKWLSKVLYRYNSEIGNDQLALFNAELVAEDSSYCVVTGQQLGYFGGPAYTFLKGLSCLMHARRSGAIPIFWLATEDHDIAEIDHAESVDPLGNLQKHFLTFPRNGQPVEDLVLTQQNVEEVEAFARLFGVDTSQMNVEVGRRYSSVMATFMAQLFKGTGMLFVEPYLLREKAVTIFQREIEEAGQINELLQQTTTELIAAGGRAPLRVEAGETNLFYKNDRGLRKKIVCDNDRFKAGDESFSMRELLDRIGAHPYRFSVAAAARPLLQSELIPTLAYVAGPSEVDYHRQLKSYFKWSGTPMPWVVPRVSMTFVPSECARYLEYIHLQPWQEIPKGWNGINEIASARGAKEHKLAVKEILADAGIPYNALHILANVLRPHDNWQERSLNWCWIQSQTDENLIAEILKHLKPGITGHHYCYLGKKL